MVVNEFGVALMGGWKYYDRGKWVQENEEQHHSVEVMAGCMVSH